MSSASVSEYVAAMLSPVWGTLQKKRVEAVTVEPVGGPWKGNICWGNRITKDMPPTSGVIIDVTDSHELPGPPRSIGVTLFRNPDILVIGGSSNESLNADVYAQITYGSGSVSNTFFMDWGNGGSFALQANTIRISAQTYPPLFEADFIPYNRLRNVGTIPQLILAATIGIDGVSPPRAPTYTTQMKRLTAATVSKNIAFTVPPFARRVWPIMHPIDLAVPPFTPLNYSDYLIETSGNFRQWQSYALSPEIVSEGIPLPAQASTVSINLTTNTPQDDATGALVFELGL